MHADEANQAVKLGELLDAGSYAFDPRDHHGPTLYYAAVPIAWLRGERSLATLTETTVRLVPALFGTTAVVLLVILGSAFCREASPSSRSLSQSSRCWPALAAGLFFAVSPPAVYFSRNFIQETLLLTFFLAAIVAVQIWWRTGLTRWAIAGGACVGLMQATKASAPLFVIAAVVAVLAARPMTKPATRRPRRDFVFAVAAALFAAALLYSSFGTNLTGVRDAFAAYTQAFARFGAESGPTGHEKTWWYYLNIFGWDRVGGLVWHQVALSALAAVGVIVALGRREPFLRGVAFYTLIIVGTFSVFAYKTPWHTVHFAPGFALLAAGTLFAVSRLRTGRLVAVAFALIVTATLFQQTWRASFLRPADQRNPYAYVHSSFDVLKYRAVAEAAVTRFPELPIRIISEEYWPLPWYLRGLPKVAFHSTPPDDCEGALVIVSSAQAEAVRAKLRGTYRETILGLRPGFLCVLFNRE
jgi:uncharacterized protein (TIGR03663 family)